jgi:hypothetical protein
MYDRKHPANARRLIGVTQVPVVVGVMQVMTGPETGVAFKYIDTGRESL